ncbi:metallophosphoesterase [Qipengyuania marisflavi]|uniref:Phosphohydrolase n=1 Tax=Qipengyuania marisflavi TaxID=2486356 RepID=A0A5S3P7N5_9SPHN|nr:metallophosphoesterase [Qipengyuania marisflavi]TMM49042.1 phosphohydrolase [Qipengyuania marisflavi]
MTKPKRWQILLLTAIGLALLTSARAWEDTMADPVVRRTTVSLPDLPSDTPPLTLVLISDIHVAGPDMPPSRLARIVDQVNALQPDIVAIADDFISEKRSATHMYAASQAIAPLAKLTPRLATIAVPGNHDHWFDMPGITRELEKAGITLLVNSATQAGPLAIGGLDDGYTGKDNVPATMSALARLSGAQIMLGHSPDAFPQLPPSVRLMLAGHTHCGQIAYPWGGAPAYLSEFGDRYACGRIDEGGKTLIVGAGLGTSLLPIRLFTKPTIWVVELVAPAT